MEETPKLDRSEEPKSKCEEKDGGIRASDEKNYIEISLQKRPLVQKMIFDDRKNKIKKIILEENEFLNGNVNLNNNNNVECEINNESCKSFRKCDLKGLADVKIENSFTIKEELDSSIDEVEKTDYEDVGPHQDEFSHLPLELRPGVDRRHKVACVPEAKSLLERRKARRETKERGFLCKDCHMLLPSFAELKKHVIIHQVETKHKCPECGKCFQRSCDLTLHRRVHSANKPHVCTVCRRAFTQKINMLRHMQIHTDSRPFKCDICPRAFISRPELDRHYRRHEGPMPHYCGVCKDRFLLSSELGHHIATLGHEIGRALCSICGLLCNDKTARDSHIKEMHKKERKAFQCHDCGKRYSTKLGVTRHILSQHGNDGRFGCQFCGAHFYGDSSLQAHLERHAGARNFPCNECDKTFYSATTLNRHFRTHSDERPFLCETCNHAFKAADALRRHQVSVHERSKPTHACQNEGCTEVFTSRSNMLRHVRSRHYGIKPFKCQKCSVGFTSNSSLQYHLQRINNCTESVQKKRRSRKTRIEGIVGFIIDDRGKNENMTRNKKKKTVGESLDASFSMKKNNAYISSTGENSTLKTLKKVGESKKVVESMVRDVTEKTNMMIKSEKDGETVIVNVKSETIDVKNENVGESLTGSNSSRNLISKSDIVNDSVIKKEVLEENRMETVVEALCADMFSLGDIIENTVKREMNK